VDRPVKVGVAQISGDPYASDTNRRASVTAAREAFASSADVVVLPELIVSGYVADAERLRSIAEPLDGPTVAAWQEVAGGSGGIVVGGFCERDGEALYNSAVAVGADGVLLHYRKLHLFDQEKDAFRPGDLGLPVVDTPHGRLGVCVCYDFRFVEVLRALSLEGAELVCAPTAWVIGFDRQRWDDAGLCPQAHAVIQQANLDQVFVACASQVGRRGATEFLGSSIVADPHGHLALGPLPRTDERLEVVAIDLADTERARRRSARITPRDDRRTDVYGLRLGDRVL
jgi:N-carbamoylputrescine amidase